MYDFQQQIQDETSSLTTSPHRNFLCNICKHLAEEPVVTPCGHLFCWKCVHNAQTCLVCEFDINTDNIVPIYTSHQSKVSRHGENIKVPPKPKAKNLAKIRNNNVISRSQIPFPSLLNDTISRESNIAGNGYMASTVINILGESDDNFQELDFQYEDKNMKSKITLLMIGVISLVFTCLTIAIVKTPER